MFSMDSYLESNRRLWNEFAAIHAGSELYQLAEFKQGKNKLNPLEREEVGDVRGRKLLHLQCHFGMDTLSWAQLGAEVTGVDFSDTAIQMAQELSKEVNLPGRFVCSTIENLPDHLGEESSFDIVFTSYGVITWLPTLKKWAEVIHHYLKPGGIFYIAEFHPFAMVFDDTAGVTDWHIGYPYFNKDVMRFDVEGSYADRNAKVETKISYEWQHTLGEVISELAATGLHLEYLHEFPYTVYRMFDFTSPCEDGYWRPPENLKPMPLIFSMRWHKPA